LLNQLDLNERCEECTECKSAMMYVGEQNLVPGPGMHHASNQISGIFGSLRSSEGSGSESSWNPDLALKKLANPSVNGGDRTDADPGEFEKPYYRCCFRVWCGAETRL